MNIAIVAVAYNRIDSLSRLLQSVSNAYYESDNVTLIISVDKSKTDIVEKYADEYVWNHGPKIVDKHEKNLGLRPHMMSLGKWFDDFDAIIVLEDDLVVAKSYYLYAQQTVAMYHEDERIAGISLYAIEKNGQNGLLFSPMKDMYDTYFIQMAISWGEIWMKNSWLKFYEWYQTHQEFQENNPQIPHNVLLWDSRSWLKYHMWYCIEEYKYFVFPYTSLTTNSSDPGEHASASSSSFEVALQQGVIDKFRLPDFQGNHICYDAFFENEVLYKILNLTKEECCLDLNGTRKNKEHKQYWLTTNKSDYKIIKSFDLARRPIESNVINGIPGKTIFLYDTFIPMKNEFSKCKNLVLYNMHRDNMPSLLKQYGFARAIKDTILHCIKRIMHK